MTVTIAVFWDVTPCILVKTYLHVERYKNKIVAVVPKNQ